MAAIPEPRRPAEPSRCLRHHVWMAACQDCAAAHQPQPREPAR